MHQGVHPPPTLHGYLLVLTGAYSSSGQVHAHWVHPVCQTLKLQPEIRAAPALTGCGRLSTAEVPHSAGMHARPPRSLPGSRTRLLGRRFRGKEDRDRNRPARLSTYTRRFPDNHPRSVSLSKPRVTVDTKQLLLVTRFSSTEPRALHMFCMPSSQQSSCHLHVISEVHCPARGLLHKVETGLKPARLRQ